MENNITTTYKLSEIYKEISKIYTQSNQEIFEKNGRIHNKYSVFVNLGSSANLLSISH